MGDLHVLLQRVEGFRRKLEQLEGPGGAATDSSQRRSWPDWRQTPLEMQQSDRSANHTLASLPSSPLESRPSGPEATVTVGPSALWHQRHEQLRKRWESCANAAVLHYWQKRHDPRLTYYERTTALLEFWQRSCSEHGIPPQAEEQLWLCLQDRLQRLEAAVNQTQRWQERYLRLVRCYQDCLNNGRLAVAELAALAEAILDEARQGLPICWEDIAPLGTDEPTAACPGGTTPTQTVTPVLSPSDESLAAATESTEAGGGPVERLASYVLRLVQVLARMLLCDSEWRAHPLPALTAGLVADLGWLRLPPTVWHKLPTEWSAAERQAVHQHPLRSAKWLAEVAPDLAALLPVVAAHHQPPDRHDPARPEPATTTGTALACLLAVADAYTWRRAPLVGHDRRDSRQALTEVLLLAEQGELDHHAVGLLARLSFYPVGTLVELSDGSSAVVLVPPTPPSDPRTAHRPLVARLTTPAGTPLSCPELLPLASGDRGLVLRPLPLAAAAELLRYFPDLTV